MASILSGLRLVRSPIHILRLAAVTVGAAWLLSRWLSPSATAAEEDAFSEFPDAVSDAPLASDRSDDTRPMEIHALSAHSRA